MDKRLKEVLIPNLAAWVVLMVLLGITAIIVAACVVASFA